MAFDAFVRIDGIEGESKDFKHKGWIEILRYGMGVKQAISTTDSSAGGASVERVEFKDFVVRKLIDKSSPLLTLACANGTHIDEIVIELCRAGTDKVNFMTYKLNTCFISSVIATNGSDFGNKFPSETVKFNFGKIEWRYRQQNRQGGELIGQIAVGWDLQRNCKL